MSKRELVLSTKKLPPSVRLLCGNPPVLSSEKRKDYESLFGHMADCVKPTDFIEWLWLKDVVDHTWEIRRLRRFKNQLFETGVPLIETGLPSPDRRFARAIARLKGEEYVEEKKEAPKPKPKKRKRRLSGADEVQSLRQCLNDYHTLDRLLISAEDRRNSVLREIDRRRDDLAHRLRGASDDVIDAEFSDTAIAAE